MTMNSAAAVAELIETTKKLFPILEAVRLTAGLRGNQLERIERAKAAVAKVEALQNRDDATK